MSEHLKITKDGKEINITEGTSVEEALGKWKELVLQTPKTLVDIVLHKREDNSNLDMQMVPLGEGAKHAVPGDIVLKNAYFKAITLGQEEIPQMPVKGFWYVEDLGTKYYGTRVTDGDSSIKIWTSRGSSAPSTREKCSPVAVKNIKEMGLEEWTKHYTCDAHY